MSGLRLLLVTDAVGGVWIYSLELARALRPLGVDTVLAVVGPAAGASQRADAADIPIVHTGLPLEWLDTTATRVERAGERLAELAQIEGADIIQTPSASLLAGANMPCPSVAVQHSCLASWWAAVRTTTLPREFEWRCELVQRGLHRADVIVAPSMSFAAETTRIYGASAIPVHNGRTPLSSRDIPQGQFVFTAGRLWDEGKNVATLDAAAARLEVPFQAAGPISGPNGATARFANVDVLGALNQTRLAALYSARPIYASAALYEPFGLSVLEAAQAGCALVLSDIPTHREMWGGAAIFVPARQQEAFATAIDDLLRDPDERQQLASLAAARARQYTPSRMARSMSDIYAQLCRASNDRTELAGAA